MIRGYKKGFTLIELMLAMSFISVLLLSIAMVGIQAGKCIAEVLCFVMLIKRGEIF